MSGMPKFYLNSFAPLVTTKAGRDSSIKYNIPPFVDGSIRREPDFQHSFPAITCLCRGDRFAPRLRPGDLVAYATRKQSYGQGRSQQRLIAVVHVLEVLPNHSVGSKWYLDRELPLPNNCLVHGNPAKPLRESHRIASGGGCSDGEIHREWDKAYRARAMQHGTFVVCKRMWSDLSWDAPEITKRHLLAVYGRRIGTLNPGAWEITHARHLFRLLQIAVRLSDR
jgi:hypothetical protein